jgi:hypothetical protein
MAFGPGTQTVPDTCFLTVRSSPLPAQPSRAQDYQAPAGQPTLWGYESNAPLTGEAGPPSWRGRLSLACRFAGGEDR